MTGQAGSNQLVDSSTQKAGCSLTRLYEAGICQDLCFNPDSGLFCSALGRRVLLIRSNGSVMFLRARKVQAQNLLCLQGLKSY